MNWADFVVRGTIVLTAAFVAAYLARRASAAVRHFVWTAAFVAVLLLPAAMTLGPRVAIGTLPAAVAPTPLPAAASSVASTTAAPATPARQPLSPAFYWTGLYLAGALLVLVRFAAGAWRMRRILREATPVPYAAPAAAELAGELAISRRVRILESPGAAVPMTWGVTRPVVLLPESARSWPEDRLHAVLLHELVHVARYDLLAQVAAQAVCCLYWFHPLAWLAARQLRKERERACDDAVLERGIAAPEYAGHLMELARGLAERRSTLADAPAMAETGDLEDRVRALLDRRRNRGPLTRTAVAAIAVLACALIVPLATLTTYAQAGRGALAGIVQDPSGSRVPGPTVRAKNLDAGNEEVTKVNAAGEYGFPSIPAGRYEIEVQAPGFKLAKKEIVVVAGAASRADVALQVGNLSEKVTVRAPRVSPAPAPAAAAAPQRIPIGGNVKPARVVRQVRPVYPPDLKQQGVTGTVTLRAIISKEGEPLNPQVVNTVHPGLAQAALDAVKQWRYEPTLLNGHPVEVAITIDVAFELDDAPLAQGTYAVPVLLAKVEPEYSEEARKAKYQGNVLLKFDVNEEGRAENISVLHAIGLGLDERAIDAVRKWRYRPAMLNGKPVTTAITAEVVFRLL